MCGGKTVYNIEEKKRAISGVRISPGSAETLFRGNKKVIIDSNTPDKL